MSATVLVLTKLPGLLPVKTRLWPRLGRRGAERVYRAMLRASLDLARTLSPEPIVAFSPPDADAGSILGDVGRARYMGVAGASGSQCLERAIEGAWSGGPLVVLGGDAPDLPVERLEQGLAALATSHAAIVPSGDGGFSALVLREPVPGLASGFVFGEGDACASLRAWLAVSGRRIAMLAPWPDVDTPADLAALVARLQSSGSIRSGSPSLGFEIGASWMGIS